GRVDRTGRVRDCVMASRLAHVDDAICLETDDRGHEVRPGGHGDYDGPVTVPDRDGGIGGAEVDADNAWHPFLLISPPGAIIDRIKLSKKVGLRCAAQKFAVEVRRFARRGSSNFEYVQRIC